MVVLDAFVLCLVFSLSSSQLVVNTQHPSLGSIYAIPNNNSVLNFTFIYPTNYQFDNLYVRFTIYDFIGNETTNPQAYPSQWGNFTNSNVSLPWVVPNVILQSGDYVFGCFEWLQTNNISQIVVDTNTCVLTRAPVNNTIPSLASITTSIVPVTNTTAMITGYFPAALPYDRVTITSAINETILPAMSNPTSNSNYSVMNTFMYTNLSSNTHYNICVVFNYANSVVNGSQAMSSQCQMITTVGSDSTNNPGGNSTNNPGGNSTNNPGDNSTNNPGVSSTNNPGVSSTNTPGGSSTINPGGNSTNNPGVSSTINPGGSSTINPGGNSTHNTANMVLSNTLLMILLFVFILF